MRAGVLVHKDCALARSVSCKKFSAVQNLNQAKRFVKGTPISATRVARSARQLTPVRTERPVTVAADYDFGGAIFKTIIAVPIASLIYFVPVVLNKKMGTQQGTESILKIANTPQGWRDMRGVLTEAGVESITGDTASDLLQSSGAVLVDVRSASEFAANPSRGRSGSFIGISVANRYSVGVVKKNVSFKKQASDGTPVEEPDFIAKVKSAAKEGSIIIVDGSATGTLNRTAQVQFGRPCQALIAAYVLAKDNVRGVVHVEGGYEEIEL
ncbi:hypothetical protein CYMTET_29601 [Cymbomonas tetramitiformis]|uniref:Rhodanese domain-containing protein n=1 Tax=Cymbomonas tetramitiformis TaxID=36881 RepID=A0AAE0FKI3_9CHLO|nr:hypothetical protein CYMTET_29601 [Cymbomonas tetramitiformis]